MFWFKKAVAPFLFPVPICLFLLGLGVVLLWFTKRQRLGKGVTTFGFILLLLFSFNPIPEYLMMRLERTYPVFDVRAHADEAIQWVVVLSGSYIPDPTLPPNDQLGVFTLSRLVEGVRILQAYPDARLLVSGGSAFGSVPPAVGMREVALLMGVDSARIVMEDQSWDTKDQAVRIKEMVHQEPFVLVTSAAHLPRSMALFEKQGMAPLPGPANHGIKDDGRVDFRRYIPSASGLMYMRGVFYEHLGRLWAWLRGQT